MLCIVDAFFQISIQGRATVSSVFEKIMVDLATGIGLYGVFRRQEDRPIWPLEVVYPLKIEYDKDTRHGK